MNEPVHFSIVMPTWSGTRQLAEMALRLCETVRPMCDELIVTEDAGVYCRELQEIADLYLMHRNLGDVVNINLGLRIARGEYICAINSDVEILEGNLRDLCVLDRVVCPGPNSGGHGGFTGGLYVVPRAVLDAWGYPDETKQYAWLSRGQGADAEYEIRIKDLLHLSDKIKGVHRVGWSYSEKRRVEAEAQREWLASHPNREIDPTRHLQRLGEDPLYWEQHHD